MLLEVLSMLLTVDSPDVNVIYICNDLLCPAPNHPTACSRWVLDNCGMVYTTK